MVWSNGYYIWLPLWRSEVQISAKAGFFLSIFSITLIKYVWKISTLTMAKRFLVLDYLYGFFSYSSSFFFIYTLTLQLLNTLDCQYSYFLEWIGSDEEGHLISSSSHNSYLQSRTSEFCLFSKCWLLKKTWSSRDSNHVSPSLVGALYPLDHGETPPFEKSYTLIQQVKNNLHDLK